MRIILHVSFATLLLVALLRSSLGAATAATMEPWAIVPLGIVLGLLYFAGTLVEKRRADAGTMVPPRTAVLWLAAVTALWLVLLIGNTEFSWLAFPLFFIHLNVLPSVWGALTVTGMTAAVIVSQLQQSETPGVAMVLGPLFGVAFAIAMTWIYRGLFADLARQQALVAQLQETQADLARTQHEAGVITERERMAREIHDTLAQGLSSIILVSRAARSALAAGETDLAGQRLEVVETAARENLAEARNFVRGISAGFPAPTDSEQDPTGRDSAGWDSAGRDSAGWDSTGQLGQRLAQLCAGAQEQMRAAGNMATVTCVIVGDPQPLPIAVGAGMVRITQTLLGNVVAHSGATTCVVTVSSFPDSVTIDVYDSGRGFTVSATDETVAARRDGSGFGLRSAAQRIADLGGKFVIDSELGRGTLATVEVPLDPTSESPKNEYT